MSGYEQRREAAMTEIQRLIDGGKFRMTVPVEEGRDSDTILGAVVRDSRMLERERDEWRQKAIAVDGRVRALEGERDEALEKVESQRAHLDKMQRKYTTMKNGLLVERDALRAQVQTLREALERAAAEGATRDPAADLEHVQNIAREALAVGEDGT